MSKTRRITGVVVAALLAIAFIAWHSVSQVNRSINETLSRASIAKLRHAISDYLFVNGSFPPRILIDPNTNNGTSWRVLVELLSRQAESEYDLTKNWDFAGNIAFAARPTYVLYNNDDARGTNSVPVTNFVALESPDAVIGGTQSMKKSDVKDGLENTLLVAQVLKSSIPWSEPRDVDFRDFERASRPEGKVSSSNDEAGFKNQQLLFADLKAYHVMRPIPRKYFEALWTRAGNDGVTRNELVRQGYLSQ